MIIKKAFINGFGKYTDKEFLFHDGLNVIFGQNEAGKSTLLWFIRGMLYGLKGGRTKLSGEQPPLRKYQPWAFGPYSGVLELQKRTGEVYTVTRDFENRNFAIYDAGYHEITEKILMSKDMQPGEFFLGMNESCFESTCFIGSDGAALTSMERKDVESRLMEISETGFIDISLCDALLILDEIQKKDIGIIGDKRSSRERPLNMALVRIRELESRISEYETMRENLAQKEETIVAMQKTLRQLEDERAYFSTEEDILSEVALITGDINKLKRLSELSGSWTVNRSDWEEVDRVEKACCAELSMIHELTPETHEIVKNIGNLFEKIKLNRMDYEKALLSLNNYDVEIEKLNNQFKGYEFFDRWQNEIDRVFEWMRILPIYEESANSSIDVLNKETEAILRSLTGKINRAKILMIPVFLLGLLGGTAVAFINPWMSLLPAGAAALIISLLWIKKKQLLDKTEQETKSKRREMESAFTKYSEIKRLLNETLEKFQCHTFETFRKRVKEYKSLVNEREAILLGREMQQRLLDEKFESLKESTNEFNDKTARYKKVWTEKEEETLARIEQNWHRFQDLSTQVKQCEKEKKRLFAINKALLFKVNLEGYPDFHMLSEAIRDIKAKIGNELAGVKEKVGIIKDSELMRVILDLGKDDTDGSGDPEMDTILKELSEKNKANRERIAIAHRTLLVKETTLAKDMESLWQAYEGYKNAVEERERLINKKDELLAWDRVIKETEKQLKIAGEIVKKDFYEPLSNKTRQYAAVMTAGRHKDIKVGGELSINAKTAEGFINVMDNSTGTVEQIFLALRLAILEQMEKEVKCPVFADEIFAAYDDQRVHQTLGLLAELAKSRQIFLFTCRNREPEIIKTLSWEAGFTLI